MGKPPHLICIVDDDLSMRRALGRLVSAFGFEVKLFTSGRQCLDEPHVNGAACIIIDVSMPDLNGFELHALLTAAGHNVPTIFISGNDNGSYQERADATGCVAFLDKPCDEKLLHDAIKKAIGTA
jgi:FixJ family two-component response regulator